MDRAKILESAEVSQLTELALPFRQIIFNADQLGKFALLLFFHGADEAQAPKLKNMNISIYHGALDPTVPVERSRNMASALQKAGNTNVLYVELPNHRHFSWEEAFGDQVAMDKFFSTLLKK